ncbi:hypothetical protein VWN94_10415, partial [Campylobacter coli]|uniref:carbamoyl phosphate synthase preATP-grasp domain-containing protein n=1 Tax=Campylobacter coli TaxID=195 RepID=UPI002E371392
MIIGGGPNRIGQGIEFYYACVHASFALKDLGVKTIMYNCNPEMMLFSFNYLFAWFNVLSGSFLTASNKASFSLILSLSQNLFIP